MILAVGASLAVILAKFWMKEFKTALRKKIPETCKTAVDINGISPECSKKITSRKRGVACKKMFKLILLKMW